MKKIFGFAGVFLILAGFQSSLADNLTPSVSVKSPTLAATPSSRVKKHKKKASAKATVQPTETVTPSISATVKPSTTTTPIASNKTTAKPTEAPTPSSSAVDPLVADGDKAYAAKDYTKALSAYGEFVSKHGKTPEIEKKLLLSKFYAGQALEEESRKGIKAEENYIKSDDETHNFMVYGKRHPSREARPFAIGLAVLTPLGFGADLSYTIAAHWNIGFGVGALGFDPRIKYYFNGDLSSFFLGVGYASYALPVAISNVSFKGSFTHFTLGAAFQDPDGFFMELPIDVGPAHFEGEIGDSKSSGSGGGGGNSSSPTSLNYDGVFATIGFRWGYSF